MTVEKICDICGHTQCWLRYLIPREYQINHISTDRAHCPKTQNNLVSRASGGLVRFGTPGSPGPKREHKLVVCVGPAAAD